VELRVRKDVSGSAARQVRTVLEPVYSEIEGWQTLDERQNQRASKKCHSRHAG